MKDNKTPVFFLEKYEIYKDMFIPFICRVNSSLSLKIVTASNEMMNSVRYEIYGNVPLVASMDTTTSHISLKLCILITLYFDMSNSLLTKVV